MSLDRPNRWLSAVTFGIVALSAVVVVAVRDPRGMLVMAFMVAVLGLAWAMAPSAVVVDERELRIERRAWPPLRVLLATVASVEAIRQKPKRALRLFGVGGFFGSYGLFWSDTLGRHRVYATRGGGIVVRRRDALPIVVTPDDAPGTLDALSSRAA